MIQTEKLTDSLQRTWSDTGMKILQNETGRVYDEAVDVIPCRYTYSETSEPIDPEQEEATEEDYLQALQELGVDTHEEG